MKISAGPSNPDLWLSDFKVIAMRVYKAVSALVVYLSLAVRLASAADLRSGDLIFQTSRSEQSAAIQLATHSKYSHVGLVWFKEGKPMVYEAARTVQWSPLEDFVQRGMGGHYVVKRLRDTELDAEKLNSVAGEFLSRPYDFTFSWSDDRIYCSELVWKIFDRAINVQIGEPQKLRDFDLSNPIVKAKLQERYGQNIPLDEMVISPQAMFASPLLELIEER